MKSFEITIACENVSKGERFVALFYDGDVQRRFSASSSGDSPVPAWEAIAWLFDEYIAVTKYGAGPNIARKGSDRPGDRFARLTTPGIVYEPPSDAAPTHVAGSKPSAAARRSTAKKRIKK